MKKKKIASEVTDNGSGMPAEVQEQIFVPFFSPNKQDGDVVLSLWKQIMLLHKATISLQSQEGSGTTFLLKIS